MEYNTLNQFDVVRLVHTKNIKYLSGPPGRPTAPKGDWAIVGFIDRDCILAKQSTIIRVPPSDIRLIASYQPSVLEHKLAKTGSATIDIPQIVSKMLEIDHSKATELCKKYRIPLKVESRAYVDKAVKKLKEKMEAENGKR
jgi:hypothetical protein